ncbi:3-oxoacyl-[acyl-carrier-protein] synthase III C-terminal domain-containing protein [Flagellimonas algicola]|uniref:3-oxoacyl-ACP synthase n=1 Tax=Flagellimonas algicola TaxID=2583815 RepID=A0ABY2WMI3_9FLAO|nr:3-oxoacyl-[acyl-carrier-protein] synthase III C-terminal domain-containing protein [Allomuricauda algicola]TMU55732.1 3-oxoacyl-ACP synthase [Allomuricauda algicola]
MNEVYINSMGCFLPNKAISNDEMEDYLGRINGKSSRVKSKILDQNGIENRYYALNKKQESTHSNAELAAEASKNALKKSGIMPKDLEMIAVGTTQGDLPVPGFASLVHAELGIPECELANFQSVCSSGMMAVKSAFSQIKAKEKTNALCIGSEFASRLFKASRFEGQGNTSLPFDTEFLRWMLSDGAGAMVLANQPNPKGLSLKIEWIDIKSHAHEHPLCMYVGDVAKNNGSIKGWLDYPDYETASAQGAINLKQNTRLLDKVIAVGVSHYFSLIDEGKMSTKNIDWLCCHYSSQYFKQPIKELLEKGGAHIPEEKWFSNLTSKGNTGAASIFIMLEELMYSGKLKVNDTIICMVPESGQFITSFMKLKVVGSNQEQNQKYPIRKVEAPELNVDNNPTSEWLVRQLTQIWIDFENKLLEIPIVQQIHQGTLSLENYKLLLMDLRQQVIDGSQWISRAASNIDIELFELRSAFIRHTATEHKDYQLLEKNFVALGEPLELIQGGEKNIGSMALSSYMFQMASKPNPINLLGAMFIIEGIGKRLAGYWGNLIQDQLQLKDNQVSFLTYHGVADENHFHRLEEALNHPLMNLELAEQIAKTAKTTALLYHLQLKELGNY